MKGTLYVCATPIGNLEDITLRVISTLKAVDLIAAEDTRQTLKLLNHYEIKSSLESYHEHNKDQKGPKLIRLLSEGKSIALVSDAGMPGISDPGEDLIRLCYENEINVTVLPGATAVVTALVLSGLKTRSYVFEGFLPSGKKQRRKILARLKDEERTIVLYEAPHHLVSTLNELYEAIGDRKCAIERELTKKHETVQRLSLSEAIKYFTANEPKGEFVVVLEGVSEEEAMEQRLEELAEISIPEQFESYLAQGMDEKKAMKLIASERGISKRDVYAQVKL